jgi:hypothetical protein
MKSMVARKQSVLAVALTLTILLPAAWAKGIDEFQLAKAIPADAFLAVHTRDHAGKEFVNRQFARVWEAVAKQRFDRDLKRLFKAMQQEQLPPGQEPEGFDEQWQQMSDLFTSVDWGNLGKREFAMGMKLGFPMPEMVMLMMPPEDRLKESFEGLEGIAKALVELAEGQLTLATEEDRGAVIHRLTVVDTPFPFSMVVGRHRDVIVAGFGTTMLEQSLALLRGEGGEALASTRRFQQAFQKLPAPTDELTFFDVARFMGQLRQIVRAAIGTMEPAAPAEGEPGYEEFVQWKALPGKIIDTLDIWEYMAAVSTTDGMRTVTDAVTVLHDDAKSRPFYAVLYGNQPLREPLKYVPREVGNFWVTSGVDLHALYKLVIRIIREDVPNGEQMIAQFEAATKGSAAPPPTPGQEGVEGEPAGQPTAGGLGLDIEKDIIAWIGGKLVTFSIPGPTPYSPGEWALMVSVRDEAKAREMLGLLFDTIEPILAGQNGSVVDAEIEGAEGFKSVVYPMLAMMGMTKPTLGVKDGWLFFGSSPTVIASTLKVAAGETANFSTNDRFVKEGIAPEGRVTSLSFQDMRKWGEQLGQALQMVPMMQMAAPQLARDPKMQALFSMISKAGRIVRELNFFQSSASRTTFDGRVAMTKMIVNYREPPKPKKPKPAKAETQTESVEEEPVAEEPVEE